MQRGFGIMLVAALLLAATAARAEDVWQATRTLLTGEIVQAADIEARAPTRRIPGAIEATRVLLGQEMRRRVPTGAVLTDRDIGPRLAVQANAQVRVLWQVEGLQLEMAGRSLEAGAPGQLIRVLNTATSRTIRGTVREDGAVLVGSAP
jgi:flagella basal body P-ring formation protein FlgA